MLLLSQPLASHPADPLPPALPALRCCCSTRPPACPPPPALLLPAPSLRLLLLLAGSDPTVLDVPASVAHAGSSRRRCRHLKPPSPADEGWPLWWSCRRCRSSWRHCCAAGQTCVKGWSRTACTNSSTAQTVRHWHCQQLTDPHHMHVSYDGVFERVGHCCVEARKARHVGQEVGI
jgi:hypothetical protein